LGALGRFDEALTHLDEAIRLTPLNGGAYHNRAVIYERKGEVGKAIAEYKKAVRFGQGYGPSREALKRLTGSGSATEPTTEAERRAQTLSREASVLARKGRYAEAMQILDEAEKVAPEYSLVQQYRSNVAFLMGDKQAAIAALKRALEIEPDNPLFRVNLSRLEKGGAKKPAPAPSAPR
jgi:tetratricopeptide (TPR) repeat protein